MANGTEEQWKSLLRPGNYADGYLCGCIEVVEIFLSSVLETGLLGKLF